nr:MAG: hypothetical protein DIU64_11705 [Caldicoprobacter oshimai]
MSANKTRDVVVSEEQAGQDVLPAGEGVLPDQDKLNSFIEALNSYIAKAGLSGQLSVSKQGYNVVLLRIKDSALFDSGQAKITPKAEQILRSISKILKEYADFIKMIRIEGHTDNRPIHNEQFDSNWGLSTSRAVNVLRRLLEISSLGPEKFSAVGYGEFHPIADNNTEAGRALNRRVDFVIETVID